MLLHRLAGAAAGGGQGRHCPRRRPGHGHRVLERHTIASSDDTVVVEADHDFPRDTVTATRAERVVVGLPAERHRAKEIEDRVASWKGVQVTA